MQAETLLPWSRDAWPLVGLAALVCVLFGVLVVLSVDELLARRRARRGR